MNLTEEQERELGEQIVKLLSLRRIRGTDPPLYNTEVGTKTALGLGRTIVRIVEEIDLTPEARMTIP